MVLNVEKNNISIKIGRIEVGVTSDKDVDEVVETVLKLLDEIIRRIGEDKSSLTRMEI